MASSQVEIIASSPPFGCVLTNHINGRDAQNKNTQKPTWVSRVAKNNNNNNNHHHLGSLSFTKRLNNFCGDHKDDSSSLSALVSPRHSRIIDRWAARQAREVATKIENENVVEVFDNNFPSRSSSFTSRREVSLSPPRSDGSSQSGGKTSNLGASSLVQIWEKRLNQSNSTKPNTPQAGRTSSDASCNENEEHCRVSEEAESLSDEPFLDWESDKTDSLKVHCLDAAERERGWVADIIKRLTVTNQMQSDDNINDHELSNSVISSPYRERDRAASTPKQLAEHRGFGFGQVISSPRIRGRQAFNDLIMQFESDRHGELENLAERGAVSKFTQRGRIQSLLRHRLLQRGVAAFDPSYQKSAASEGKKQQGTTIMQLKGRFNKGDEVQRTSSLAEVSDPSSLGKEIVSSTTKLNSVSQTSADNKEETHPSSDVTFKGSFFEAQNDDPKETVGASPSMADSSANETANKVDARDQQYDIAEIRYDEMVEEEEPSDQQYDTAEISYDEMVKEEEPGDQTCDETRASYDWISTISRPRSYWEERRREWYSEMLDFGSDNDERRKLLERRTVSTVLSSDFRERMDKLMKSHKGTQTHLVSNHYDEEDQEGSMEHLMAFFHDRLRVRSSPQDRGEEEEVRRNEVEEEEEEEEKKAEEQEEESIISGSDHELGDYQSSSSIHTPSSSTWSYRDNDGGDDSDRVASLSSPLPSQSQPFYQDTRQYSSSINHPSIEMEFVYDLRGQMEQLFREMSELRKSIKTCTDMQMQMQQSKNREVHTVKEKKLHYKTPKKGNCCICHEKKVNSVLYRCGHMCACLKCANELQWKSGKCPICQVPIIDVVRVYTDTEYYMMDRV